MLASTNQTEKENITITGVTIGAVVLSMALQFGLGAYLNISDLSLLSRYCALTLGCYLSYSQQAPLPLPYLPSEAYLILLTLLTVL